MNLPRSPFPTTLAPQLATLTNKPPEGEAWVHEIKWDGYRMIIFKKGKEVRIISRNNKDWTVEFQNIANEVKLLPIENLVLDGEMVILDEKERSNFQLMQNSIDLHNNSEFIYYVFDLIYYAHWDIRSLSLLKRKELLKTLVSNRTPSIKYSDHIIGEGFEVFKQSCEYNLEGIISKLAESEYQSKRTKNWLKIKCLKRQEFVIAGFTPPQKSRACFGSLYLGVYNDKKELVYSGNVGTGFTDKSLKSIYVELQKRIIKENPFNSNPPGIRSATWIKPELICEVEFTEWTSEHNLRHPSFKGLRSDKKAMGIKREAEIPLEKIRNQSTIVEKANQKILTNPQKIVYKEDKITKGDIFSYYEQASTWMLPYVKNRPLTLVRCPENYESCFYQKHYTKSVNARLEPVQIIDPKTKEIEQYVFLKDVEGILALAQMGVLEIHPWGSTIENLYCADVIIFDLDPAPEVQWDKVVEAAFLLKEYLENIQLQSYVKTTGGKGLHVVVPILPEYDWVQIKAFTKSFVETIASIHPSKFLTVMSKQKRKGKIFLDYLRNQWDTTAIGVYSTRARAHATVAIPISWDELSNNKDDNSYDIFSASKRLRELKSDPWVGYFELSQSVPI
ncbi:MAG: DNA ligase D [Tatlockia sp.]|nr:DNA ligase D [Tatlockia sp.]